MSRGTPPICLNHQGAGEIVTPESGIKIEVTNPNRVAQDFANAFISLYQDDQRLRTLSEGALAHVREYTWDSQGDRMAEIYRQLIVPRKRELVLRPELMEENSPTAPPEEVATHAEIQEPVKW